MAQITAATRRVAALEARAAARRHAPRVRLAAGTPGFVHPGGLVELWRRTGPAASRFAATGPVLVAAFAVLLPCTGPVDDFHCTCDPSASNTGTGSGGSALVNVLLHVRALMELNTYSGGTPSGDGNYYLGGSPLGVSNSFLLQISNPSLTLGLNYVASTPADNIPEMVDYVIPLQIAANATLTLSVANSRGSQGSNNLAVVVGDMVNGAFDFTVTDPFDIAQLTVGAPVTVESALDGFNPLDSTIASIAGNTLTLNDPAGADVTSVRMHTPVTVAGVSTVTQPSLGQFAEVVANTQIYRQAG